MMKKNKKGKESWPIDLSRLRRRAEKLYSSSRQASADANISDAKELNLIEELSIQQIELELQNEELWDFHERLLESHEAYYDLWEQAPVAYLLLDQTGRVKGVNRVGRELFGGEGKDIHNRRLADLIDESHLVTIQLLLEKVCTGDGAKAENREIDIHRPDGTRRRCQLSCQSPDHNTGMLQVMLSDITERYELERVLQEKEERLRLAVDGARLGTWDYDLNDGTVVWNRRLYDIFGLDPATPISSNEAFWTYIHEEDRDRIRKRLAEICESDNEFVEEFRIVRRDGEVRWLASSGWVYRDEEQQSRRLAGITRDITDRKLAELEAHLIKQDLEQRVEERTRELSSAYHTLCQRAKQLARLSNELTLTEQRERRRMANILHDNLQQFLIGIKINLEILSSRITEEQREAYSNAYNQTLETIDISRSLTSELAAPVVLQKQGLAPAFQWLKRWMEEKFAFHLQLEMTPHVNVRSEELSVYLFQSVREVLMNVIKHSGTNQACLTLKQDEEFTEIEIADQGKGFDLTNGLTRSGFGLFSIRERLELLGGRLEIESTPGQGTLVRMEAPIEEEAVEKHAEKIGVPLSAEGQQQPASSHNVRLLLADDHVIMRQALSSMLAMYDDIEIVGEASNGKEAVELTAQLNPDVILMDVSMPLMDGLEATKHILSQNPNVRIIGLSMHDRADQAAVMFNAGASAYCSKTGDTETLLTEIRRSTCNVAD